MKISHGDIDNIALGGSFLATGGGGDMLVGRLIAKYALEAHGDVDLLSLDDLDDGATVIAVGGVGAPTIMQEKISNGREPLWALEALERYIGKTADALIAFEAGGLNALVPFIPAVQRGLPVLDADGMGRALPELQMESFSIYGVSATPLALASEHHDTAIINARNSHVAERLVRDFAVIAGGGHCISAEHVMDGATAKRVSVPGTISLCLEVGRRLTACRGDIAGFLASLAECMADTHYGVCRRLFEGKVVDVDRRVEGGFDVGEVRLEAFSDADDVLTLTFQNEFLVARRNQTVIATVPDLICLVDNETVEPITAERMRYGQRATVIGIGAPDIMRSAQALTAVAPRCFGFDLDYVRLEDLAPQP